MHVYIRSFAETPTVHLKCAIYSDVSGTPTSLVDYTEQRTFGTDVDGWVAFTFVGSGNLVAGSDYWLIVWTDAYYYSRSSGTGSTSQDVVGYSSYNSFPSTFPSGAFNNNKVLIYCTYEET